MCACVCDFSIESFIILNVASNFQNEYVLLKVNFKYIYVQIEYVPDKRFVFHHFMIEVHHGELLSILTIMLRNIGIYGLYTCRITRYTIIKDNFDGFYPLGNPFKIASYYAEFYIMLQYTHKRSRAQCVNCINEFICIPILEILCTH